MTTRVGAGEFGLSSLNAETGWIPMFGLADDIGFIIAGTFVGTITIRVSSQSDATKTRYVSLATTYTAPTTTPLAIPRNAGRYVNFVMTAYTSGTAYIGISAPNSAGKDGVPSSLTTQLGTNVPVGDSFS